MTTEVPTPWEMKRGDDFSEDYRFWLDENKTQPDEIVGDAAVYTCQIRKTAKSDVVLAELTCSTSNINELNLLLEAADTATVPVGTWVWDLQEVRSGRTTTPLSGTVEVTYDVTR